MGDGQHGDEGIESLVGTEIGTMVVQVERGPVQAFAEAVLDMSPEYRRPDAAADAGYPAIPAPPTYPIALTHWGAFAELQSRDDQVGIAAALVVAMPYLEPGGLILHGEQEFEYHRPVLVGDVLVGTGRIADAYRKESKGRSMTFIVSEMAWTDERTGEPVVTARSNVIWRV